MGDFDKNTTAKPEDAAAKQKKQMMMVGALGGVLLLVVGYQMMKAGPQTAAAAGPETASETVAAPQETPAQALAALDPSRDPTKDLLLGSAALPEHLTKTPRNPFKLSDAWKEQLKKAEPVKNTEPIRSETPRIEPVTAPVAPQAKPANVDGMKVAGILKRDGKLYAIINGNIVTVGGTIGGARVVDITDDRVMFRHVDWANGPVTTLAIQGRK